MTASIVVSALTFRADFIYHCLQRSGAKNCWEYKLSQMAQVQCELAVGELWSGQVMSPCRRRVLVTVLGLFNRNSNILLSGARLSQPMHQREHNSQLTPSTRTTRMGLLMKRMSTVESYERDSEHRNAMWNADRTYRTSALSFKLHESKSVREEGM